MLFPTHLQAQTLDLNLSTSAIAFASADPDTTPAVTAPPVNVRYRVRGNDGGTWRITVMAGGDLTSGAATIPIGLVTWTTTPAPPFQNGTMGSSVAQTLAAGTGNEQGWRSGTIVFSLENRWTHNTGVYSTSITFTIVAP
jgi:hypothetical protein